jgi:hypothetical protein
VLLCERNHTRHPAQTSAARFVLLPATNPLTFPVLSEQRGRRRHGEIYAGEASLTEDGRMEPEEGVPEAVLLSVCLLFVPKDEIVGEWR